MGDRPDLQYPISGKDCEWSQFCVGAGFRLWQNLMVFIGGIGGSVLFGCDRFDCWSHAIKSGTYFDIGMVQRDGGWKPSCRMQVAPCACNISVSFRRSVSNERTCDFNSIFCVSNISDSLTRFNVRSRFFIRHLVAAILFRSRRRRRRSSSSGVNCDWLEEKGEIWSVLFGQLKKICSNYPTSGRFRVGIVFVTTIQIFLFGNFVVLGATGITAAKFSLHLEG